MQKPIKPSFVLALGAWVYVFVVAALRLLGLTDPLTFDNYYIFVIIAIMASAVYTPKSKTVLPKNVRININGVIFTDEALTIHELRDGDVFIYVDTTKPMKKGEADGQAAPPAHMIGKRK